MHNTSSPAVHQGHIISVINKFIDTHMKLLSTVHTFVDGPDKVKLKTAGVCYALCVLAAKMYLDCKAASVLKRYTKEKESSTLQLIEKLILVKPEYFKLACCLSSEQLKRIQAGDITVLDSKDSEVAVAADVSDDSAGSSEDEESNTQVEDALKQACNLPPQDLALIIELQESMHYIINDIRLIQYNDAFPDTIRMPISDKLALFKAEQAQPYTTVDQVTIPFDPGILPQIIDRIPLGSVTILDCCSHAVILIRDTDNTVYYYDPNYRYGFQELTQTVLENIPQDLSVAGLNIEGMPLQVHVLASGRNVQQDLFSSFRDESSVQRWMDVGLLTLVDSKKLDLFATACISGDIATVIIIMKCSIIEELFKSNEIHDEYYYLDLALNRMQETVVIALLEAKDEDDVPVFILNTKLFSKLDNYIRNSPSVRELGEYLIKQIDAESNEFQSLMGAIVERGDLHLFKLLLLTKPEAKRTEFLLECLDFCMEEEYGLGIAMIKQHYQPLLQQGLKELIHQFEKAGKTFVSVLRDTKANCRLVSLLLVNKEPDLLSLEQRNAASSFFRDTYLEENMEDTQLFLHLLNQNDLQIVKQAMNFVAYEAERKTMPPVVVREAIWDRHGNSQLMLLIKRGDVEECLSLCNSNRQLLENCIEKRNSQGKVLLHETMLQLVTAINNHETKEKVERWFQLLNKVSNRNTLKVKSLEDETTPMSYWCSKDVADLMLRNYPELYNQYLTKHLSSKYVAVFYEGRQGYTALENILDLQNPLFLQCKAEITKMITEQVQDLFEDEIDHDCLLLLLQRRFYELQKEIIDNSGSESSEMEVKISQEQQELIDFIWQQQLKYLEAFDVDIKDLKNSVLISKSQINLDVISSYIVTQPFDKTFKILKSFDDLNCALDYQPILQCLLAEKRIDDIKKILKLPAAQTLSKAFYANMATVEPALKSAIDQLVKRHYLSMESNVDDEPQVEQPASGSKWRWMSCR